MGLFKRIMADKKEQSVTTKQQIGTSLSQRDSIEKLNLMEHSFNALTHAGVQTVGELLKLVESGELRSIHGLRSTSILEIEVKLAQLEIVDNSEVEANMNATPEQNDVPLSREAPIEKSSLTQPPPNQLHTNSQAVSEVEQQVKSSESPTISEGDANLDTMPDQNDASLSQEDATEEPSLPQHSPNPLIDTEGQTVGEGTQHVESAEIQTISEGDANTDTTPDQNSVSLPREDSIERLSLTRHTLNLLKHTDIQTVGDLLQWVESGRLQTIPTLGRISILEIEDELSRVPALDDAGVDANSGATPDQNDVPVSQEDSTEDPNLTEHSPNPHIHTESQTVGEDTQQIESSELQTIVEGEADTNETLDQNDPPLPREDSTKKIRLTRDALNRLKHTDVRTVGQLLQWVESGKSQTTAEAEADTNETPDQNDVSPSREDSTEEQSLTQHSPNPLIHTDSQAVGEDTQHIESSELQTIAEGEADTDETSDQNDVSLSREDPIEKLRLTQYALNRLKHTDIRTVGELLQWVESDTTPALGQKSISKIKERLAQAKTLDGPETEANTNEASDQNDASLSREASTEEQSLTQHTDLQTIRENGQQVESSDPLTISEVEADTDAIPEQNDILSQEDSAEEPSLTQHAPNPLINADSRGREGTQQIESSEYQTTSEITANTDTMLSQDNVFLSREDSIEKLNLTQYSFNALTAVGVKTVGEVLKLVESGEHRPVSTLGRKFILEIEGKLAQVKILDDSETEANTDSQAAGEVTQHVESSESQTIPEGEANVDAIPDQNDISLSQKDSTEEPSLPQRSPNPHIDTDSQTVGEVTQHVESSKIQTVSEVKANTNAALDQNDTPLSRKDPIEKLGLTHRSLNVLKHIDIQTVGELLQWVESGRLQIIHRLGPKSILEIKERLAQAKTLDDSEGALNTNETSDQNDVSLSREDSIERLSLTRHTRNLLKHTDIRTVGDLLQWVESGRLQTIPALGKKSILEIKDELARVNSLDDSGVKANSGATPDQNDVSFSREDATEEPGLPQHSLNPPIQTESQTVREGTQHIESSELQTTSEVQVNTDTVPDRNDTYLSRGDAIEKLNLPQRSLKTLKRANIRTVGELSQRVELGRLRAIRGLGQNSILEIQDKLAQVAIYDNYVHLSQADSIGQLNLRNRSFNALTREGIQTIGELLQLVESGKLKTIPALGRKSILEIKDKLAQVKILSDSEGKINTEAILDRNYVHLSQDDPIERLDLTPRSFNALTRTKIRTIGDALQLVESNGLKTIRGLGRKSILEIQDKLIQVKILNDSEVEANIDLILDQNSISLSREDPIEKLHLSGHSSNMLVRTGIQTVGEVLQLIESVRLQTIRELGTKCILEITAKLTQVKILNDSDDESRISSDVWSWLIVKIVNDAEVESIRRKDEVPEQVIGAQLQLISKQLSRGLLHKEAIIAETPIKDWPAEIKAIKSNQVYEVLTAILGSSINICEEIEFLFNQISIQYRMPILLSMYGFVPKTLAQTGDELGISRERVRQIRNELKDQLSSDIRAIAEATAIHELKNRPALLRMQSALLIAGDLGMDITYEQWIQRIRASGLVGNWISQDFAGTDAVEVMIAICNLLEDCKIRGLQMPENLQYAVQPATEGKPNVPAKILNVRDTLSNKAKKLINRHTKFSGGVYATWLSQEMEMELEKVIDILQGLEYRVLSKGWFVPDSSQISYSDVFHRCLRKMFRYCGRLGIDDICAGIRHRISQSGFSEPKYLSSKATAQSRSAFPVPPPDVMTEILRIDSYQCDDELYYWEGDYDQNLNKGESIIMHCLEQIGPVLHHFELVQAFIKSELSLPTLPATLNSSPLFDKVESGLYKLRGKEVTYQDIERAKAAREKQPLRPEIEYDTEGNIIVSVTLSAIAVGSGTILCERFPDLSGANWECYINGEEAGELNAVENEFRRLKKPFELLNCQPGERVKFTFNTWERTVEIEKEEGNAKG